MSGVGDSDVTDPPTWKTAVPVWSNVRACARPLTSSPKASAGASPTCTEAPGVTGPRFDVVEKIGIGIVLPGSYSETIPWKSELENTSTDLVWSSSARSLWRPRAVSNTVGTGRRGTVWTPWSSGAEEFITTIVEMPAGARS